MAVRVLIDGLGDVAPNVIWAQTELNTAAQGEASLSQLILRDFAVDPYAFKTGKRVTIDLGSDETRIFGGYLWKAGRQFWFPADDPERLHRRWRLQLVDNNILFNRRVVYKKSDPAHVAGPTYGKTPTPCDESAGIVYDDDAIAELVTNWLDLSIDGIDVSTLVHQVASITYGQPMEPWNGSMTWGEAMTIIAQLPAAIFYLDPWWRLVYADVDTETAPFDLSDRPVGSGNIGPRLVFSDTFDRVVARGLGGEWTWVNDDSASGDPGTENVHVDGSSLVMPPTCVGGPYNYVSYAWPIAPDNGIIQFDFWVPGADNIANMNPVMGVALPSHIHFYVWADDPGTGTWRIGRWEGSGPPNYAFTPDLNSWYTARMSYDDQKNVSVWVWKRGETQPGEPLGSHSQADSTWIASLPYLDLYYNAIDADVKIDNFYVWDTTTIPIDADALGYRECTIWDNGAQLTNEGFGWGFGKGVNHGVFKHLTDAASVLAHGLWQDAITLYNVWCQPTIDKIVNSSLYGSPSSKRGRKDDVHTVELVTRAPLRPGQVVRFINHEYDIDETLPVRSSKITFDSPEIPKYTLKLGHVLDKWGFQDPSPKYRSGGPGGGGGGNPNPCPVPPCEGPLPGGGGGCTDAICGITDTFTRTVVDGWGTSDAGPIWAVEVGPGASASVGGDHAIAASTSTGGVSAWLPVGISDLFDLTFDLRHEVWSSNTTNRPYWLVDIKTTERHWFEVGIGTNPGTLVSYFSVESLGDDYTETAFTPTTATSYTVRVQRDATTIRAKIWPTADAEPAGWTLSCDASAPVLQGTGSEFAFYLSQHPTIDPQVWIDNLDISGVNRCAGHFDDFDRTVASGWGGIWTLVHPGNVSTSVDGTNGIAVFPQNTIDLAGTYFTTTSGPWASDFTLTCRVRLTLSVHLVNFTFHVENLDTGAFAEAWISPFIDTIGMQCDWPDGNWYVNADVPFSDGWYLFKWEYHYGTSAKLKVWPEGSTEPDWMISRTDAITFTPNQLYVWPQAGWHTTGGDAAIQIDYIDFDYDGKPCYQDCSGIIAETFTRTVAPWNISPPTGAHYAAGTGWGTGENGIVWYPYLHAESGVISVNGNQGIMVANPSNSTSLGMYTDPVTMPSGDWDVTFTFRTDPQPLVHGQWYIVGIALMNDGFDSNSWITELDMMILPSMDNEEGQGTVWFWGYWSDYTWDTQWTPNTEYNVRLHWDSATHWFYARLWVKGSTEPSTWNASQDMSLGPSYPLPSTSMSFEFMLHTYHVPVNTITVAFDDISLGGCTDVPPSSGVPSSGHYCEDITAMGDTMTLSRRYVPGSIVMTGNGLLLTPGSLDQVMAGSRDYYEADWSTGIVQFGSSRTRTVHVCYEIAWYN